MPNYKQQIYAGCVLGVFCFILIASIQGCNPQSSEQSDPAISSLQRDVTHFFDVANSSSNQEVIVESQRKVASLCRETPDGFNAVASILEQRLKEHPEDHISARFLKGIYLRELRHPDKAVELYEELLRKDPNNLSLKQELVQLYQASERYQDAADFFRKEVGTGSGNDEWLVFQAASHLIYAGKTEEGLAYAKSIFETNPSAQNFERMSRLYETAGQWDIAAQNLQKAVSLSSNEEYAVNLKIHLGEIYFRAEEYEKALSSLKELMESSSLSAQQRSVVNEQIFRIYKKEGRLPELKIQVQEK